MGDAKEDQENTGLEQLGDKIQELVEKIAKDEGFQDPEYHVTAGSKKGDNYIGVVHRIKVEGKQENGHRKSVMSLIVKRQPASAARREQFRSVHFFNRESHFYNDILPALKKFQSERGVEPALHAPASPKCYHASDVLIVEDMCHVDFRMCDRRKTLSYQHCSVVLKELARFHAVSLAFKDQKPDEYKTLIKDLDETFLISEPDPNLLSILDNAFIKVVKIYKERVDDKGRYLKALENFTDGYYKTMMGLVDGEKAEPYSVITHGDIWINNFLFKYDKNSNTPNEVCLLDYQLLRYSSPVTDVCHFIFCCTDKAMRDLHYKKLLVEYHETLAGYMKQLGSDPEQIFPYEAFQDHLMRYGKFGFALAVCFVPLSTCEPEDALDLDEACEDVTSSLADKFDKTISSDVTDSRVCDVVDDMVELGYIS